MSYLCNQFRPAMVTAWTTLGTNNPRISAQAVRAHKGEIVKESHHHYIGWKFTLVQYLHQIKFGITILIAAYILNKIHNMYN